MQAGCRFLADGVASTVGPQSGAVQRLVRVNVANPGNRALIQQQRLDRSATVVESLIQIVGAESKVEWFRSKVGQCAGCEELGFGPVKQTAEPAWVPIAKVPPVVKREDDVRVLLEWRLGIE